MLFQGEIFGDISHSSMFLETFKPLVFNITLMNSNYTFEKEKLGTLFYEGKRESELYVISGCAQLQEKKAEKWGQFSPPTL